MARRPSRENDGLITHWISEPDQGIYDAWNKACKMARGEWLLFLGAGDELAGPHTLAECLKNLDAASADTTIVYGRQTLLSPIERTVLEPSGVPWAEMTDKWEIGRPALPPHGSTFQRKNPFSGTQPFDLRFRIASDSHFLLRAIKRPAPPVFMSVDIARAPMGGCRFVSIRQDRSVAKLPPSTVNLDWCRRWPSDFMRNWGLL
jgi:hypothetical protein